MPTTKPRFKLGQTLLTQGAIAAFRFTGDDPRAFVARHVEGDWGDLDDHDRQLNDEAVAHEGDADRQGRVLSAYQLSEGTKIWIISEWDRSVTTILLPGEY